MDTASYERGPSQPVGTVLDGTYRLVRRIGFGGMGEVYEATHVRLPGRFAVKILLPDLLGNREAFARFCREAEIMSELRHPNIVQIFDFNAAADGRPYFVMEYLEGRDLETRLSEGPALPLAATVRIVNAVASALAAAHGHGVVHRDLKPANIFLDTVDGLADEVVKVLDFGISQVRSPERRLSHPTHVLGTPPYMAPEQIRGAVEAVDGRADQFALGAIAYRMLTGIDAFRGDDTPALLYQIVHERPSPLGDHLPADWDPRPLGGVLDRALAKEPPDRWGGMIELARAFEDAAERTLSPATISAGAVAALAPGPAISDEPPPVRLPATAQPKAAARLHGNRDFTPDRAPAVAWDLPSDVDRVPLTRVRAAAFGSVALALAGILIATGWYRQVRPALPFARESFGSWFSTPDPLEQPGADQTTLTVLQNQTGQTGQTGPAGQPALTPRSPSPAAAAGATPAGPRSVPHPHRHHRARTPVAEPPASSTESGEVESPEGRATTAPGLPQGPPEPAPLPGPAPVGAGSPRAPGGFSIPPPADQAPARDLAPPPDPEYAPPPPRPNSDAPPPSTPSSPSTPSPP